MSSRTTKINNAVFTVFLYTFMCAFAVSTIYPFINMLAISFNDAADAMRGGIYFWPRRFTLLNYKTIFGYHSLPMAAVMSVLRTVVGTVTGIICTTMLSFTLIQKDFILKKPVSILFVITLYVGGGLIPDYFLIRNLGLINNFFVYIIPGLIGAWNVIVIRAYMEGIPDSIQESARMDGANDFIIYARIIFPLCTPVIATIGLFIAVGQWNSWFDTFLYASRSKFLVTLQYELMRILLNVQASSSTNIYRTSEGQLTQLVNPQSIRAAITMVATVPILLIYPAVQKHFVKGIQLGAVKE